jgi:signal recognition particle subunit SRP54
VPVASAARDEAERTGRDVVVVDTAGRLAIDAEMMAQAAAIRAAVQPTEVLLVVDAMTGQDAVATAQAFQEGVDVTGFVLTKLDGDARGGAALSIRSVTGRPIKFAATGEKLADFDAFHPDRLAGRILGMGDVLTLIERAEEVVDREQAEAMERKLREASFTLEDFLDQLQQVKKMGPLSQVLGMLPGMGRELQGVEVDDRDVARVEAIIRSMTPTERNNPKILNGSRRARIARGSGTTTQQVNAVLKQFDEARRMMKQLAGMTPKRLRKMGLHR